MPRTTIRSEDITAAQVKTADMAVDPTNASNLSSGDVPAARLGNVPPNTGLQDDIALLGFKVASNGSLSKYNLVDQTVDSFEDATGVNTGASTSIVRNGVGMYYSGGTNNSPTGGTETSYEDSGTTYQVSTFTANGNYIVPSGANTVEALLVGGGGKGGNGGYGVGGGGGGAVLYRTGYSVPAATYAVVVGTGATTLTGNDGNDGGATTFNSFSATGGGGGGGDGRAGRAGANGGGAGYGQPGGTGTAPTATGWTVSAGLAGGSGYNGGAHGGGGGGGATVVGENGTTGDGGNGGTGKQISINNTNFYWGAGGAGGVQNTGTAGDGGLGGGGGGGTNSGATAGDGGTGGKNDGADGSVSGNGGAAGAGTGSGGGGEQGNGADGVAIFVSAQAVLVANMTLVSANQAAQAAPTKGDIVFTWSDGTGTATLGTDITAEVSADGGSTWTAFTLGSEGSTGSHNIATAHDTTISSTISAPYNMVYRIKTLNQSAGVKDTRIHGVSLGWS